MLPHAWPGSILGLGKRSKNDQQVREWLRIVEEAGKPIAAVARLSAQATRVKKLTSQDQTPEAPQTLLGRPRPSGRSDVASQHGGRRYALLPEAGALGVSARDREGTLP